MQHPPASLVPGALLTHELLTAAAREAFGKSGRTQQQAADELGVHRVTIANAIGAPERPLTELRIRIIEAFGGVRVVGPLYRLESPADSE